MPETPSFDTPPVPDPVAAAERPPAVADRARRVGIPARASDPAARYVLGLGGTTLVSGDVHFTATPGLTIEFTWIAAARAV
jgi:hypothetical protein